MISALFLVGIRYRKIVYVLVGLFTLITGAGLTNLKIDTSFNTLIPSDEPERLVYQRVMDEFGSDNKTIVYVKDGALWSPEKLSHLDELVRGLKLIPAVNRVADSIVFYQAMEKAGQTAKLDVYEGLPHCFHHILPDAPESKMVLNKVISWFTTHLELEPSKSDQICIDKVWIENKKGKIACVTPTTADKLVERGWGTILS